MDWVQFGTGEAAPSLSRAFEEADLLFGISAVSIWETITAMEKGRVIALASPEITVRTWLRGNPFRVLPLDEEIAILSRTLPFQHDDPADRFIASTAYHLNCPLATADDRLRRLDWLPQFN